MFHNMGSCPSCLLSLPDGNLTSVLNICPCGSGGIKDFKNARAQSKPVWNWSGPLHRCLCEPTTKRGLHGISSLLTCGWNWFKQQLASMHHLCCHKCVVVCFQHFKADRVFKHSVQRPHETARWHVSTLLYAHLHWAASIWPNMSAVVLLPLHYQISASDTFTQSNKGSCFLIRVQRSLVSKYALSSLHSSF